MGEKYLMWYQVELQKWKWSPQHSGRVEKVGEDRQAEWGKERSDRWHRSSRGLWYRVFKHSYGPLQHFKDSFGPSQHLIASLCWHNKTAHGMTPLCSFPCQVLSCGTSFSEQSWPISACHQVAVTETIHDRTPLCSFPCQVFSDSTKFSRGVMVHLSISASHHVGMGPFVTGPLSAPSQVSCWAMVQQFSGQGWSTLASQHLASHHTGMGRPFVMGPLSSSSARCPVVEWGSHEWL